MERFNLGTVFGTGFRVWFRNPIFLVITAIVYAPFLIWAVVIVNRDRPIADLQADLQSLGNASMLLVPLLNILVSSALVYGVVMELKGEHASPFRCLGTGLARFFPVLGVAILTILAIVGGLLLLIVPGLIVATMLYVTTEVAVLERPGVFGALARSRELTAGRRWEIFAVLFFLWLIDAGLSKGIELLMAQPAELSEDGFRALVQRFIYIDLGRAVVVGSLSAVMSASAYYYLRLEKEGTGADELGRIFE